MGWLILPFVLKHNHQISTNNIYDIGIEQHILIICKTCKMVASPNYMFLTIYRWMPKRRCPDLQTKFVLWQ